MDLTVGVYLVWARGRITGLGSAPVQTCGRFLLGDIFVKIAVDRSGRIQIMMERSEKVHSPI